ncbi:hypothetical protein DFH28DRAFT_923009 [Melampsora americana]|nr:hypothetical protein DFH28DRAFT_923009 [Melampsora americana]
MSDSIVTSADTPTPISTQTGGLDSSTSRKPSGASLDSKQTTPTSGPTIGVSSVPPEIASAPFIPVGMSSESQTSSQDSVVKSASVPGSLNDKSPETIPRKDTLSDSLDSDSPNTIPCHSHSTQSDQTSTISPLESNQTSNTIIVPASNKTQHTSTVPSINKTQDSYIVPSINKTQESSIVPAINKTQDSPIIPAVVKQQSSVTPQRTNVNLTTSSPLEKSSSNDGASSLQSDANERKSAAAGMEKVNMDKKGGSATDLEKGKLDGDQYLSEGSLSGSDESHQAEGYFGKKGIIRSSRPRSLLLKEAAQGGRKETWAISQTPSIDSQPQDLDEGLPGVHLRPNRYQNRPNSWRSNKKPIEAQTYRPPAPHYRTNAFQGPAADHSRRADRLSQIIREEEESYTSIISRSGSYTESSIGSSKLSRSSSSGCSSERITESLQPSSTLGGSYSGKSGGLKSDQSGHSSDESDMSSKANSFFTEEIGLNEIHSNIGSQLSLTNTSASDKVSYPIGNSNAPVEMMAHAM